MRILLNSYSAETHSSYGKVTRDLWTRLIAMNPDWEVIQHGWFHKSCEPVQWEIVPTQTGTTSEGRGYLKEDMFGAVSFEPLVRRFNPDLVWTLCDTNMVPYMPRYAQKHGFDWFLHVPIDGAPVPVSWWPTLRGATRVIPVTKFGAKALEPVLGYVPEHIYHGVNTKEFMPITFQDRMERRQPPKGMQIDTNTFYFGFVGQTQFRKMNWFMFQLMRYLLDGAWYSCRECGRCTPAPLDTIRMRPWTHDECLENKWNGAEQCSFCAQEGVVRGKPLNVALWYHSFERPNADYSPSMLKNLWGLEGRVIFTDGMTENSGVKDTDMPGLYRAFDAYLSLSGGEGYGLPAVEAMASGVPVVYTDYAGQGEIGKYSGGYPVQPAAYIPNTGEPVHRCVPDLSSAIQQCIRVIESRMGTGDAYTRVAEIGLKAVENHFDLDRIAEKWNAYIHSYASKHSFKSIGYKA